MFLLREINISRHLYKEFSIETPYKNQGTWPAGLESRLPGLNPWNVWCRQPNLHNVLQTVQGFLLPKISWHFQPLSNLVKLIITCEVVPLDGGTYTKLQREVCQLPEYSSCPVDSHVKSVSTTHSQFILAYESVTLWNLSVDCIRLSRCHCKWTRMLP